MGYTLKATKEFLISLLSHFCPNPYCHSHVLLLHLKMALGPDYTMTQINCNRNKIN